MTPRQKKIVRKAQSAFRRRSEAAKAGWEKKRESGPLICCDCGIDARLHGLPNREGQVAFAGHDDQRLRCLHCHTDRLRGHLIADEVKRGLEIEITKSIIPDEPAMFDRNDIFIILAAMVGFFFGAILI